MPSKVISNELKEKIKEYYLSQPMSLDQVGKEFNLSRPTIARILEGIPRYPKARIFNPELKERFFQTIDTEEKAYFLGLLIADGNVFKDDTGRQASISITLDLNDEYMLHKFKEVLHANTSVGHDGRGCGQIAVRSNLMADDLQQYGVVPRKTELTYLPANIPSNMMPHLIRGIFDGDGSIQAHINEKDPSKRFLHDFSFCGTHKLMEEIAAYCYQAVPLQDLPTVYDYKDKQLSDIKIRTIADMHLFGEWMYQNATIYLIRKKEKYDFFKQHYQLSEQDNPEVTNQITQG